MIEAAKYKVEPNKAQRVQIGKTLGCCRFVHNTFLALRRDAWKDRHVFLNYADTSGILAAMKHQEHTAWLKEADATALQNELTRVENAYQGWFQLGRGFPKFKRKHAGRQSYTTQYQYSWLSEKNENGKKVPVLDENGQRIPTRKPTIEVRRNAVKLPKLGWVRARVSRFPKGKILSATVSRDTDGSYYVSLAYEIPDAAEPDVTAVRNPAGVDCGVKTLAVTSAGKAYKNHKYLRKSEKKRARAQRSLSRKRKGSKNYAKQREDVAKIDKTIKNQRLDSIHKATSEIVREHDAVFIEDLNVKGMMKNHKLAKSLADASMGEFGRQLEYKCRREGKVFGKVG